MNFVNRIAVLVFVVVFYSGLSLADCKSELEGNGALKSRWAHVFQKNHPEHVFLQLRKNTVVDLLAIAKENSLGKKDEQFLRVISDLESWLLNPDHFSDLFMARNQHTPSIDELVSYFDERLELIENGISELDWRLKIASPALEDKFSSNWLSWFYKIESAAALLRKATNANDAAYFSRKLFNYELGFLAEVRTAFLFDDIVEVGVLLGNYAPIRNNINIAIKNLMADAKDNTQILLKQIKTYPYLFKPVLVVSAEQGVKAVELPRSEYETYFSDPKNIEKYLEGVRRWMHAKEVDFIREFQDGTIGWVETKGSRSIETLEPQHAFFGKKTRMDQLLENLELVDFIGLKGKVRIQYYNTGGYTDEARRYFEERGIEVLR